MCLSYYIVVNKLNRRGFRSKHTKCTCKGPFTPGESESEKDQRGNKTDQRKYSHSKENFAFLSAFSRCEWALSVRLKFTLGSRSLLFGVNIL